ncbi:MAG: hypothetical protein M3R38_21440 [Actinomycetota bacterium]|nr:hypothetical protein [Actinomycetota bacterium]
MNLDGARRRAREARERAEKATEGPWESWYPEDFEVAGPKELRICKLPHGISSTHEANAQFIAHARTDVPELCSLVDALAGEVERLGRRDGSRGA